jgi:2-polyprenyl-6-methoxyphenol hydroxylase-like FAD-dependent oxidoreductase
MTASRAVDVLVAGAGVAGVAAAAALGEFGWEVLLVEPGLDSARRLAGELIHPPGTTDLAALGLLPDLEETGGMSVRGFAVVSDPARADETSRMHVLPYARLAGQRRHGFAAEHSAIRASLRRAVERLPHVTLWHGARVTALDASGRDTVRATVRRRDDEVRVSARLLVGADGATSTVRRLAGIAHQRRRVSTMLGYLLPDGELPAPGYGTVFLGGPAPALAYQVGSQAIRVMFDLPDDPDGPDARTFSPADLGALPAALRGVARDVMSRQQALVAMNYSILPERVTAGRVVLVGDAAGCCHPLTATGLSVCTRDAMRLRGALRVTGGDLPAALARYAAEREGPQRTRLALAQRLYEIFLARTPETRLLRDGVLRYWTSSARGRATSMALLSTQEGNMAVMAREYTRVVGYALCGLLGRRPDTALGSLAARGRAALSLTCGMLGAITWGAPTWPPTPPDARSVPAKP